MDRSRPRQRVDVADPRVQAALRARYHTMMRATLLVVPVAIPIMLATVAIRVDRPAALVVWAGAALLLTALQFFTYLRPSRANDDWTRVAVATQFGGGVLWGLFPAAAAVSDQIWQMLIGQIQIGTLAGAAIFASTMPRCYRAFVVPATVLGAATFYLTSDGAARWIALLMIWLGAFYAWLSHYLYATQATAAVLTVELDDAAATDPLTGLANRGRFVESLVDELDAGPVGVLFIDLDRFKRVNDEHGHGVGDELLIAASRRLSAALDADDVAARLGGDEFTVLVRTPKPGEMEALARRIQKLFETPFAVGPLALELRASIGVATSTPSSTVTDLLQAADMAQYVAKRHGGDAVRVAVP